MVWQSKTLGEIVPKAFEAAASAKAEAEAAIAKFDEGLALINDALGEARTALNLVESDIEKLEASGFAVICLSPRQGSWLSRLINAPNAPSTSAGYSCGYFNIATAPTEAMAIEAYNAMKAALTEKIEVADFDIGLPQPPDLRPDTEFEWDIDKWVGKTLGELMPGVFNSLKKDCNAKRQIVAKLEKALADINEKKNKFSLSLAAANAMIAGLSTSGIYQYAMPAALGSWASRAAGEAGAPPVTGDQYSFGFAAVAVASDMAGAQALYQKLQSVM